MLRPSSHRYGVAEECLGEREFLGEEEVCFLRLAIDLVMGRVGSSNQGVLYIYHTN